MPTAKDRLRDLLENAADPAPEKRAALRRELEALLAEWPAEYPENSRAPFLMLLEKVTQQAAEDENPERAIMTALRADDRDRVIALLARAANTGEETAWHALSEEDGTELSTLCRGAGLSRATFSSIVLLMGSARGRHEETERLLQRYDTAPDKDSLAAE